MRQYLNNLTTMPKKCEELDDTIVCMSGYDKPKYIDPRLQVAGDLGFDTWIEHWNKPTFNADTAVGGLTLEKYYSIMVVPVDGNTIGYADYHRGTPTLFSMPQLASKHKDVESTATSTTTASLIDSTQSWGTNDWAGFMMFNITQGTSFQITSNNSDTLSFGGDVGTNTGDAYVVTDASLGIKFNIPIHDQSTVYECATSTGASTDSIADATKSWVTDQWVGYLALNIETGHVIEITANTAVVLTTTTMTASVGDRIQIIKPKCTRRDIYALEMSYDSDVAGTYIYQGTVDNNTDTTYDLDSYAPAGETVPTSNIPPERYSYCTSADGRIFAGGGISESRGKCAVTSLHQTHSGSIDGTVDVSIITDGYEGAGNGRIARYTMASSAITEMYVGSSVTITDSTDSGNDASERIILRVDPSLDWFEIENNNANESTGDALMQISLYSNKVEGNVSGEDRTYFSEGLVYGTLNITGHKSAMIASVDEGNQTLILATPQIQTISSRTFSITTEYGLAWSDYKNPHSWRTENSIQLSDKVMSIAVFRGLVLIFCRRSLWKIPLTNLYQTATLVSGAIQFKAPFSVVETPDGILFYDGSGISITDGQVIRSVTQYKATDFLGSINQAMSHNVRGVYDAVNHRVEFVMARGTDITNNDGLYITDGSMSVYPFTRMDCNVLWRDEDDDGVSVIRHGTTGRHVDSGKGDILTHVDSAPTDGGVEGEFLIGTIGTIGDGYISIATNIMLTEGDILLHVPSAESGGSIFQFIAKSITIGIGLAPMFIHIGDDWYFDGLRAGGTILKGVIPFDYGIKWLDFSSPQYQHKVRQIQIDVTNITGLLRISHYGDLNTTPVEISEYTLTPADTKVVVPLKKGSMYNYGFRLSGYSTTQANILSFEVLFDTEI